MEKKKMKLKITVVFLGYLSYQFRRSSVVHDKFELLFREKISDSLAESELPFLSPSSSLPPHYSPPLMHPWPS